MQVRIPPLKPIPEGATEQDRRNLFNEHVAELRRLNPGRFNPDGSVITLWQALKGLFTSAP